MIDDGARRVAAKVLAGHGVDVDAAERGRGWTNATWLTDELVVRVSSRPGNTDLLRESRLVALLPEQVGYPEIVDAGVLDGHEWVLSRRVAGTNLEEVWPTLEPAERVRAVEQMWTRVRHVHRVDLAAAAPHARARSPFFPDRPADASATLRRLADAGELTAAQVDGLDRALDRFWAALPAAPRVLNHGDFCVPNTMWHDGRVVALLDFEFALVAPPAIDLNELVKMAFVPSDPAGRAPLREMVGAIARSTLPEAGGPDVLVGYAIMLEAWMLENELSTVANGGEPDEAERADASELLTAFARGDGGHYAPLFTGP
ncbi:phosphotransferase family protein [Pseudonocardia acaciae]|uniref:phosphotransferase family protein n=1 Tax=Pseudonocardia acaciae TaxID=551276 RepID=UPI00048E0BC4|nr:aminoglycoside phosphotransferase family protein [Pseudonocardia acaciae]